MLATEPGPPPRGSPEPALLPSRRSMPPLPRRLLCSAVLLAALSACGEVLPAPPSAVIGMDPEAVPLGDAFSTPVALDGLRSAPRLTLVPVPPSPGDPPLSFAWSFSGAEWRLLEGGLDQAEVVVACAGDRPLHVTLEVARPGGRVGRARRSLAVTVPGAGP